jgi:F0F1-type ATP synthase assembly protein I
LESRATQISPGQYLAGVRRTVARSPDVDQRGNQVTEPTDDRSPLAKAYQWSARIMVVALEMVLPGLAGLWLDKRLGTIVLFMLTGFALGGTAAVVHLMRMVRAEQDAAPAKRKPRFK